MSFLNFSKTLGPCHYGMMRRVSADVGASNITNKQSRAAENGRSSGMGVG